MRNTINLKDLKKSDGFPSDIDRTERVVVCIVSDSSSNYNWIAYKSKDNKIISNMLEDDLCLKYAPGIYVIEK